MLFKPNTCVRSPSVPLFSERGSSQIHERARPFPVRSPLVTAHFRPFPCPFPSVPLIVFGCTDLGLFAQIGFDPPPPPFF